MGGRVVRRAAGALLVLLVVAVVGPTAITPAGAAPSRPRHQTSVVAARPAAAPALVRLGTRSGGPTRHVVGQPLATARTLDLRFATIGSTLPPGSSPELARRTAIRLPARGPPATSH